MIPAKAYHTCRVFLASRGSEFQHIFFLLCLTSKPAFTRVVDVGHDRRNLGPCEYDSRLACLPILPSVGRCLDDCLDILHCVTLEHDDNINTYLDSD